MSRICIIISIASASALACVGMGWGERREREPPPPHRRISIGQTNAPPPLPAYLGLLWPTPCGLPSPTASPLWPTHRTRMPPISSPYAPTVAPNTPISGAVNPRSTPDPHIFKRYLHP